jgi:hypothetical protein
MRAGAAITTARAFEVRRITEELDGFALQAETVRFLPLPLLLCLILRLIFLHIILLLLPVWGIGGEMRHCGAKSVTAGAATPGADEMAKEI